ncbi:MAG: MBL fold metallo-hydrolase [Myxococcaceae bacterium]
MSLRFGRFTVHEIRDGSFALDGGAMFGLVPRTLWGKHFAVDAENRIQLALRCMLIDDGRHRILVDAGIGTRWAERHRGMYAIDQESADLDRELAKAGYARSDITDVVLTHLHFDHAGGTVRGENGGLELSFPKATYHLQRRHWVWAHHPSDRDRGSFRPEDFELLEKSGRLHLLEGETELYPGVELLLSEGHTVGLQLPRLMDGDRALQYCGDIIPTSAHLKASWGMSYDLYPLTVMEEKRMLLAQAIEDQWILFFEHDPKVAACKVREDKGETVVAEVVAI